MDPRLNKPLRALQLAVGLTAALIASAARAQPAPHMHATGTAASAALRQDMRKLWSDHVIWTRSYIVAAVADQPDAQAAAGRLMKNQEDIGAAVAKYYGKAAGDHLTALLKEHIAIAVDLIKAAKTSDKASQQQADEKWRRNGEEIADFLSKANPNWPRAVLVQMMATHLSTTTEEVVARLTRNWDADTRAFDAVYDHILAMADALSDGIVKQFPDRFAAGPSGNSSSRPAY
jgi:putative heme iron utilization protein